MISVFSGLGYYLMDPETWDCAERVVSERLEGKEG